MVKSESRVKNSSRNIVFSMIAYIIQIVLGFFVRRYFIYFLGEQYLGISSLFSNILSILSLAELGFGTAIVFAMYKPMADGDTEKVKQLMQFYKKCYFTIGVIILAIGLCVLPFMNFFATKIPNTSVNLYAAYLIYLFNSVITYFFAHRRSLLYTSQRNDIESKINTCFNIFSAITQIAVLFLIQNFYLYTLITGVSGLLSNVVVYLITQKMYGEYLGKPAAYLDKESRKAINKNIRAMIFHKIGSVIVYSTDSILIFTIIGSSALGKYSNYLLITTYVTSMINLIINSVRGSVGNSIAQESAEKNYKLFNKLNFLYMWIVSFCTICIYVLADPFIDVVLTKNPDVNLLLNKNILLLLCISFFLSTSRYMCGTFKECAGIFYQDRYKSLAEALINLTTSIALGFWLGIEGVILGTIISNLTTSLWIEPFMLNKYYMKKSTIKYFLKYLVFVVVTVLIGWFTNYVCGKLPTGGITLLIARFAICAILPNVLLLVCLWPMPDFKECVKFVKNVIVKLFTKKENKVVVLNTNSVDIDGNGVPDGTTQQIVIKIEEEK